MSHLSLAGSAQVAEQPALESTSLNYQEQRRIGNDPVHRVLAEFHPTVYRNYIWVERELAQAKEDLRRVCSKLSSGRTAADERPELRVRRTELRMRVADRQAALGYKIAALLEAEGMRIKYSQ